MFEKSDSRDSCRIRREPFRSPCHLRKINAQLKPEEAKPRLADCQTALNNFSLQFALSPAFKKIHFEPSLFAINIAEQKTNK